MERQAFYGDSYDHDAAVCGPYGAAVSNVFQGEAFEFHVGISSAFSVCAFADYDVSAGS